MVAWRQDSRTLKKSVDQSVNYTDHGGEAVRVHVPKPARTPRVSTLLRTQAAEAVETPNTLKSFVNYSY